MKKFSFFSGIDSKTWKTLMLELIVVFLGVTGGFLLNDWGTREQEKNLEQKYIDGFAIDIESDIVELKSGIVSDSLWLVRMDPILSALREGTLTIDSAEATMKLILSARKITAHTGTFETITNSGNLNLITNFDLRSKLIDYYLMVGGIEFIEDHLYNYFSGTVMPFAANHYALLTGKFVHPDVIRTVEFENLVTGYYSTLSLRQEEYRKVLRHSYELLSTLTSD